MKADTQILSIGEEDLYLPYLLYHANEGVDRFSQTSVFSHLLPTHLDK